MPRVEPTAYILCSVLSTWTEVLASLSPDGGEGQKDQGRMDSLLAVDLGLRTGLALFGHDGRLQWYRSHNFGTAARLRRGVRGVLANLPHLACLVLEGGGTLADIWAREAARRGIPVRQISAEAWRQRPLWGHLSAFPCYAGASICLASAPHLCYTPRHHRCTAARPCGARRASPLYQNFGAECPCAHPMIASGADARAFVAFWLLACL